MPFREVVGLGLSMIAITCGQAQQGPPPGGQPPAPMLMTIPGYADGAMIPVKFTCVAEPNSVSPEIRWSGVPAATKSFVLVLSDLESHPERQMVPFAHWILWNIPAAARSLPEGVPAGTALADGTHQMKGRKGAMYLGPCAAAGPSGHYMFTLYALDTTLDLPEDAQRDDVMKAAAGHVLRTSNWVGLFHR